MRTRWLAVACLVLWMGCDGQDAAPPHVRGTDGGAPSDDAGATLDAPIAPPPDAAPSPDAGPIADGIAPIDTLVGELGATEGDVPLEAALDRPAIIRIESEPSEHITFFLSFAPSTADFELEVLRWDGSAAASLGVTDAGAGLRTLAVFDPSGRRTFWARVTTTSTTPLPATLAITRVPFEDAATCAVDCAHLLQLPLPNDVAQDGYTPSAGTVFRYQYGRRDLVMFLRHAGQRMVSLGMEPIVPGDLSQWDGDIPGNDVGAPRHASHTRGKDVDLTLYGIDGLNPSRSFCTTTTTGSGRECLPGTIHDYDGTANAVFFGDFYATGRVTMCFLDRELHAATIAGASDAVLAGDLDAALVPLYSDGTHLQHWPNHDNHIHVRISEEVTAALVPSTEPAAFEPP
jgi:hypothetical protein